MSYPHLDTTGAICHRNRTPAAGASTTETEARRRGGPHQVGCPSTTRRSSRARCL